MVILYRDQFKNLLDAFCLLSNRCLNFVKKKSCLRSILIVQRKWDGARQQTQAFLDLKNQENAIC